MSAQSQSSSNLSTEVTVYDEIALNMVDIPLSEVHNKHGCCYGADTLELYAPNELTDTNTNINTYNVNNVNNINNVNNANNANNAKSKCNRDKNMPANRNAKRCGFETKLQTVAFFVILTALILTEAGIGVGVLITQKADSNDDYQSQLDVLTLRTMGAIANVLQIFQYSVVRTSAAIETIPGPNAFVGQQYFKDILQLKFARPSNYIFYFYVPLIYHTQRSAFEEFGRNFIAPDFEIQTVVNGTQKVRDANRTFYLPFTVVDPIDIIPNITELIGVNANLFPAFRPLFQNKSDYAILGITVIGNVVGKSNSGIIEASTVYNPDDTIRYIFSFCLYTHFSFLISINRGYAFGYTDIVSIVNASVRVDRQYIRAICFDTSVDPNSHDSLLFKDVDPMFDGIDSANDFYRSGLNATTKDGVVQLIDRTLYFRFIYSDNLRDSLESKTVLILSIVMATLFLIIDILFVFFYIRFIQLSTIRSMERKALDQAERLRLAEQQKTELSNKMLGYVNHELRNPLQGIMGLAEISMDDINRIAVNSQDNVGIKKVLRNNVNTLLKTTEFMKHIIDDILDIRKLEENMVDIHIESLTVHKILKNTYKSMRSKIQEKKGIVSFAVHVDNKLQNFLVDSECEGIDDGANVIIESDIFRIQQILVNLISNSLKYTASGYVHLDVNTHDQYYVTFSVVDTGRGIPDEKKNIIFSPFTQTNATDASRYGGIGLGLYLCKMLTNLLRGSIGFESQFDTKQPNVAHGSTFWLRLPKKFLGPIGSNPIDKVI